MIDHVRSLNPVAVRTWSEMKEQANFSEEMWRWIVEAAAKTAACLKHDVLCPRGARYSFTSWPGVGLGLFHFLSAHRRPRKTADNFQACGRHSGHPPCTAFAPGSRTAATVATTWWFSRGETHSCTGNVGWSHLLSERTNPGPIPIPCDSLVKTFALMCHWFSKPIRDHFATE